jgi:hypothetical protein
VRSEARGIYLYLRTSYAAVNKQYSLQSLWCTASSELGQFWTLDLIIAGHRVLFTRATTSTMDTISLLWRAPEVNPVNQKARSIPFFNPISTTYGRTFFFSWFGFMIAFWSWYGMLFQSLPSSCISLSPVSPTHSRSLIVIHISHLLLHHHAYLNLTVHALIPDLTHAIPIMHAPQTRSMLTHCSLPTPSGGRHRWGHPHEILPSRKLQHHRSHSYIDCASYRRPSMRSLWPTLNIRWLPLSRRSADVPCGRCV